MYTVYVFSKSVTHPVVVLVCRSGTSTRMDYATQKTRGSSCKCTQNGIHTWPQAEAVGLIYWRPPINQSVSWDQSPWLKGSRLEEGA